MKELSVVSILYQEAVVDVTGHVVDVNVKKNRAKYGSLGDAVRHVLFRGDSGADADCLCSTMNVIIKPESVYVYKTQFS